MTKYFKKITAFVLAFVITLGIAPVTAVYAATPDDLFITTSTTIKNQYNLNFWFPKPLTSDTPANYQYVGYRVYYRNITNSESYINTRYFSLPVSAMAPGETESYFNDMILQPGCIYTFEVRAFYTSTIVGSTSTQEIAIAKFAMLTNIGVEAIGVDNTMTVTWDLPSLPGSTPLFDQYHIYYADIISGQPLTYNRVPKVVNASEIKMVNGKATYDYVDTNFAVGHVYAVKVEPVRSGEEREALAKEIAIPGYDTFVFRSDRSIDYLNDKAYIKPNVTVTKTSLTSLKVKWDNLSYLPLSSYISQIRVFELYITASGTEQLTRLITINGGELDQQPDVNPNIKQGGITYYYLEIDYANVTYKAKDQQMVPVYNLTVTSIYGKYDPGALEFAPYRPDIYEIKDNAAKPFVLDITWKGFYRDPYSEIEQENADVFGKFFDKDITYQVAITDDPANFSNMGQLQSYILDGKTLTTLTYDGLPYYRNTFNYYYARGTSGALEQRSFAQNKIYYVRITAIRNETGQSSLQAFDSHYIMPIDKLPVQPSMIAKPPLRIKKVAGIEVVDNQSITIEWDEEWFEIYVPDATDDTTLSDITKGAWYSKAEIVGNKVVVETEESLYEIKDENNFLYTSILYSADGTINKAATKAAIKNKLAAVGITDPNDTVLRMVDIRGASYKVHVAEYETITVYGYKEYYDELSLDGTTMTWQTINQNTTGKITKEYKVTQAHNPTANPLKPGMPYVIFLRPFFTSEEGEKLAYYPTYVTATTLTDRDALDITPVVPILEPVGVTDTTVTVKWKYTQDLMYELRIDELFASYAEGGRPILNDEILLNGKLENDDTTGELYMVYTIPKLFPMTRYYIWIRSSANNSTGLETSGWSNVIEMKTEDIGPPPPPKGLGLVSTYSLNTYNQQNATKYYPSDLNYLIVEWLRIYEDINNVDPANTTGGGAAGTAEYLPNPLVGESYIVKFNELVNNRVYYVRAKTRLLITKQTDGSAKRAYSYILQISADPEFLDFVQIEVPLEGDATTGVYKDSEWVQVALITERTDTEYDGDKDPNMYPLPSQDFEIIFDSKTLTLTHRFRSNGVDAKGNNDNQVDERFITRLLSNRTFEYYVDMTKYGTKVPLNRVVEFPYTIISAFNERKINLKIKADNYTVTIPYGALMTGDVQSMTNLDKNARVKITINQNPAGIVSTTTTNYISVPQKLSVNVTSTAKTVNVINFAKPLNMNLAVSGVFAEGITNAGAYVQDGNTAGWQRLGATFDTITKSLNFSSQKAASYSAIGIVTPDAIASQTLNNMYSVNAKLSITDMQPYEENATIHANQLNQIMAAVLKGSPTVTMNTALSDADALTLGKSQILVSGATVTREAGIASLVKLYEVKTKYPVKGYQTLAQTSYSDITYAADAYKTPLLKAVELGFYRTGTANPKGYMTFGDVMHILDIILSY